MRPSPFRGARGPPNRGRHSTGPPPFSPHRPFRPSPHTSPYGPPHPPYGPLRSFGTPPPDFRNHSGPRGDYGTPPGNFRNRSGGDYGPSPQQQQHHGTPPGDFRNRSGGDYGPPRHSTPMGRSGPRFEPPVTPFRTPPSRLSNMYSNNGSADSSASYMTAPENPSCSFGSGRKSGPRRSEDGTGRGGKRRRTGGSTFPGTLLKPTMLIDPWANGVPVKRPEDGLVRSAGQRHSFLTPKKAAQAESAITEEEEEEAAAVDLN